MGMSRRGRARPHALALLAGALALAVAGCSGTGYHYVKSSGDRTYFRVPEKWRLFDEDTIVDHFGKDLTPDQRDDERSGIWQVAFDASPRPSLEHLGDPGAVHPAGLAMVTELTPEDADQMSLQALRNYAFDVDQALDAGTGEVLEYEPIERAGGFHGVRLVARLGERGKRQVTMAQVSLVDQQTRKVYSLIVGCRSACYEEHHTAIDRVLDSWTVKDR